MNRTIALAEGSTVGCAQFSEVGCALWAGTADGRVATARLVDQRVEVRASGHGDLVAVLPASDGLGVLLVQRDGVVLEAPRTQPTPGRTRVVVDLGRAVAAACLLPDPPDGAADSLLVTEAGADAALVRVDVAAGVSEVVTEHLVEPRAVAAVDATLVAALTADGVVLVDLAVGVPDLVALDPDVAGDPDARLAALAGSLLVATGATGRLLVLDPATGTVTEGAGLGERVRAVTTWGHLVLAVTAGALVAVEWDLADGPLPLHVPLAPAFLHGFVRVEADLAAAGVTAEQVLLDVEEGPEVAVVSAGLEPPGPDGRHRVRVVVRDRPGELHLVAVLRDTGEVVGRARCRVTRSWPSGLDGPGVAVTGPQLIRMWGGGPPGAGRLPGPPLPDLWRVAVVRVDTADRRMPAGDAAAVEADYRRHLVGDANPATPSARKYLREVSYVDTPGAAGGPRGTDLDFLQDRAFGPVQLGAWGDSFEFFRPGDADPWAGWGPTAAAQRAIPQAFADLLADVLPDAGSVLREVDALVFVVHTATEDRFKVGNDELRAKYVWPQTWTVPDKLSWKVTHPDGPSSFSTLPVPPAIYMPSHLPTKMPAGAPLFGLDPVATLCHELGHTFGCADLYSTGDWTESVANRTAGGADIMGGGTGAPPHFSIANRLRFGWVDPAWIAAFDFAASPVGGTVVLQSAETLARTGPRPGRRAAISVRIEPGHDYVVEHRNRQAGRMGDQNLNGWFSANQVVLGTDVDARPTPTRPDILLLPKDVDGDGPVLTAAGTDYAESDTTDPDRMFDFRVVHDGPEPGDPEAVRVRVVYERANRAQLHIEKAPGGTDWKSPDIDLAGPRGANRVAFDQPHTITVRVHNLGTFAADAVRLKVSWLPFTTSPGTWTRLPDPSPQDIAAHGVATYTVAWTPPGGLKVADLPVRHFCVMAEVDAYVDPRDAAHNEITVVDNRAQSNFEAADAPSGSPSERRTTAVVVTNTLPRPATHVTLVQQDHDAFRAYHEHAWLHLGPGESRAVELAYESLADDPVAGEEFERTFERTARELNHLSVASLVLPPDPALCRFPRLLPGASLTVRAGRRTVVRDVRLDGEDVNGEVTGLRDGEAVPLTSGQVNVVLWALDRDDDRRLTSGAVGPDSRFHALAPDAIRVAVRDGREVWAEAFYLGVPEWSPSTSGPGRLR